MVRVLLVHGMNADAESWAKVPDQLAEALDGEVQSITLPGHDRAIDVSNPFLLFPILLITGGKYTSGLSMEDYVSEVAAHFPNGSERDVILIGHSLGGAVISEVARRYPSRIAKLVYVAAMLPDEGQSPHSLIEWIKDSQFSSESETWGDFEPHLNQMKLVLQPKEPLEAKFHRTADFESLQMFYIKCSHDDVIPLEAQEIMIDSYADTLPEENILPLDSSHFPQFASPEKLAKALIEIVEK